MMNNIRQWLNGYVVVDIVGKEQERFIALCKNNGLNLYNIDKIETQNEDKINNICRCSIPLDDYRRIKKVVRKTHVVPKIVDKCGLPFMYSKHKNRQSFVVGIMLGLFIFYVASMYLWNIEIRGENYYTEEEIIRYLASKDITVGKRISQIECDSIEKMIRRSYNDIGWVSAQIEGTHMIVTIKENIKYEEYDSSTKPGHLVAPQDGVIESIYVRNGIAQVSKKDEVKAGDVLISGVIPLVNDAAEIVQKRSVKADGDVYIVYDREYLYELDREYIDRKYSGKKKTEYKIVFNDSQLIDVKFYLPLTKSFDNYDVIDNNYNVRLCKKLYMPIDIIKTSIYEYHNRVRKYSDEKLKSKAQKAYKRYIEELDKEDKDIIYNSIEYIVSDESIIAKGYVTIREKVKTLRTIGQDELKVTDTHN